MARCWRGLAVLTIGLLFALSGAARADTFDAMNYNAPAGWSVKPSPTHIDFTGTARAPGSYVMLALYTAAPASGDLAADFKREWADIVLKAFSYKGTPYPARGRNAKGLDYREGTASVRWAQGQALVALYVFGLDRHVVSLLVVASDGPALRERQTEVRAFMDSLQPSGAAGAVATPPAAAPAQAQPRGQAPAQGGAAPLLAPPAATAAKPAATGGVTAAPSAGQGGLAGPWMTFRAYYPSYDPRPRWYVFFPDGQVLEDMPRTGLHGFDRAASKAQLQGTGYWGNYSFSGGSGRITKPNVQNGESISQQGPDKIKIDSDTFTRSHPVDGVRLQGSWTSYANPNDPALDQLPQGRRPIFHFTSDGRFVDEGVFATYLTYLNQGSEEGGSGTYEARDFSMIFRYSDGRVKQVAFAGMLGANPATQNDILFFSQGGQFNKRK